VSPASPTGSRMHASISARDEVDSPLAVVPLHAAAIETLTHPFGVSPSGNAPSDSRGPALGLANGAGPYSVEVDTSPPPTMPSSIVESDDLELETMPLRDRDPVPANGLVLELANGHLNGHANGHTNGHANGHHANGHTPGAGPRRRDEFALTEVATFLSGPLVSTGFAHGAAAVTANGAVAPSLAPAIPAIPQVKNGVYAAAGKRALDIAGSLAVLLFAGPVILLAALAVKLSSRGPAFYKSTRLGKDGQPFTFYKLRSMYVGADAERANLMHMNEADGPVFKLKRDPRVTRIGQWMRCTSVDELPQLLNVLKGEMSLVGPRPPLPEEADKYEAWQRRRLDVKPGITCLWQVSGRSRLGFDEWMRLDLEYIRRQSLATDLWILVRTIPAVLSREGAY
jgi:lipopolysaccharide/colanic/teichoic acid biosynthesis glycosyltransferase